MLELISNIRERIDFRKLIFLGAGLCVLLASYLTARLGGLAVAVFWVLPIVTYALMRAVYRPMFSYLILFIVNYFIMGIFRYVPSVQGGILIDALIGFNVLVLLIHSSYSHIPWRRSMNGLTAICLIWMVYCALEFFNPSAHPVGWFTAVRGVAVYPFIIALIAPVIFRDFRDVRRLVLVLSILTLLAVAKACLQKYVGFDPYEMKWLYVDGGRRTHIIHSGVRYFSFYTDASNFGAGMGLAVMIFGVAALHEAKRLRIYYMIVAAAALYGLLISGTRSTIIIPMAGFALYVILTKKTKTMIIGFSMLLVLFVGLKFSKMGHGIYEIRRMRSAFNMDDPSFKVRLENQKLLATHMKDRPFGEGIGMGGGKAKAYAPNAFLSQIPTDSWFVLIWVETGVVGLVLHILLLLSIIAYGCYLALFRLRDPLLRSYVIAFTTGSFGVMLASYGNELYGQLPTAIILYTTQSIIFVSPWLDRQILRKKLRRAA